jgi:trafficking protein particle complex subunit 4
LSFLDVKFIAVSEPNATNVEGFLKSVYEVYADYVLKNPFYELEMPIRIELFTANVSALLKD